MTARIPQAEAVLAGNRRALAQALTLVENGAAAANDLLAALFPHTGRAWLIGVTGAPGTGKSSLVALLAKAYRDRGETVGVVAVDPTSPFSGGAILGDRIRMQALSGDPGIFIRSMATRGSLGGLARTTRDMIRVMDAAGFDRVIVETVGAGQSEVDIVRLAQTTLVVEAPGFGDDIQTIKAGILEIADILVVNKSDKPEAQSTAKALRAMLALGHPSKNQRLKSPLNATADLPEQTALWVPPVIQTSTLQQTGIIDLIHAIESHRHHLSVGNEMDTLEKQRLSLELEERLQAALMAQLLQTIGPDPITAVIAQMQARTLHPQDAVQQILMLLSTYQQRT